MILSFETCLGLETDFPGRGIGLESSALSLVSSGLGIEHGIVFIGQD